MVILVKWLMYGWQLIMWLTFLKDLHMLSSRVGLMLKKLSYIWTVLKLMAKLFEPNSHYLRERRLRLLLRLFPPHRGEMPRNLMMLQQMLTKMV